MTGPVPPPVPAAAVSAVGHQPLAEGAPTPGQTQTSGQPTSATVLAITRQGPVIEAGGQRFLLAGAPPLPEGATLSLDLAGAGRPARTGRLLVIAGRPLEPPVAIRLQPLPLPAAARGPTEATPRAAVGIPVEARLLGPDGRAAGPPIPIRLTADLALSDDRSGGRGAASSEDRPGPARQAAPAGRPLTAEVDGPDRSGHLRLRAPGLTLRLEGTVDVPIGARLQLVLPAGFAGPQEQAASTAGDDAFGRLIHALLQRPPGAESRAGMLPLPAADHALAAHLLRWVDALRAPDARPGGGAEPGPEDGPLRSALGELARQAREPQAGGWRVLAMPLGVEDPSALRLYLRDVPPERERAARPARNRRAPGQRAIVEVELSELGRCQLDVLCHTRRFDLAVRTERPLETGLQSDIRDLFRAACAVAGWAGEVEFQVAGLLSLPDPLAPGGHAFTA